MTQHGLHTTDPEIHNLINKEEARQHDKLEMIASENFTSVGVREATGSVLTNKYAEGYPHKRYYAGCEEVDKIEELAIARAKTLFHAEYANVQPHSGSSANMAVYMGFLRPGDMVMGMDLAQGGHLTHGSPVSFSGKWYTIVSYGVDKDTEQIDYDTLEKLVDTHKPKMLIAGASSYSRIIDFQRFSDIAQRHNALLLVDMAHIAGLVAAGAHPSPIPHADVVTTTTHKTLRGPRGGIILVGKNKTNFFDIMTMKGKLKRYDTILNSSVFPGIQGGPLMHVIAAKAVAFKECMSEEFKAYQRQVVENAQVLAHRLQEADVRVISGGTDNHLVMIDVGAFNVTGAEAELWLDMANITANKNAIPFDSHPPSVTSGIRLGTPAVTSRGVTKNGIECIADFIVQVLKSKGSDEVIKSIGEEVKKFTNTIT